MSGLVAFPIGEGGPSKIPASKRRVDYAVDEGDVVGGGPLAVDEWFSSLPFWGRGTACGG